MPPSPSREKGAPKGTEKAYTYILANMANRKPATPSADYGNDRHHALAENGMGEERGTVEPHTPESLT